MISAVRLSLLALLIRLGAGALNAQNSPSLDYRGFIEVDAKPFHGTGFFCFAILDAQGVILWSSGDFPFVGRTNVPASAVRASVANGNYSVRLGEASTGTPALDLTMLRRSSDPRLRIWFHDGRRGWGLAGEDVPLSRALGLVTSTVEAPTAPTDMETLLRELRELRAKVDRQNAAAAPAHQHDAAPQIATVSVGNSPSLGKPDAPVVLVEFTDYQCPFCKRFHDGPMPELKKHFVETGKLRIVARNLPLDFHADAGPAAAAALCAHAQQQFWPMREKLFSNMTNLTREAFFRYAAELKLNEAAFRACVEAGTFAAQVTQDTRDATAAGITGTPTFVLGKPNGDKVTGMVIVGTKTFAAFEAEINRLLGTK